MLKNLSAANKENLRHLFNRLLASTYVRTNHATIGITGHILGWIEQFLTGRSFRVRIGNCTSSSMPVENGVPQGAVLSPILFNIMLTDFPASFPVVNKLLFADDISIYTNCKRPAEAEVTLQPELDQIYRWGKKLKLKFAPDKCATVVFTRAYKPGDDPMLFLHGHPIHPQPTFKFLGLWFDSKLLWKTHIKSVTNHCLKLKNLFLIMTKAKPGPSTQTLMILFKSLVRSKMDYGSIAYGSASRSNLQKLDIARRSILRVILRSRLSTPVETLYAESGTESFPWRTSWLTRNYLLKLSHKPRNPMLERAKQITSTPNPLETQMHTKPNQKGYLPSKPGYKTLPTATGTPIMLQIPTTLQPTNL
jgi:hypothetical protein